MTILSKWYDSNWNEHKYTEQDKGRVLARGRGLYQMGDVSYKHNWGDENSILDVKNTGSLDSPWTIYAVKSDLQKKITEEKRIRDSRKK